VTRPRVYCGTADRPIFIGGLMKSGTSLLRVLLGQHRDVFASFETHWYEDAVREHWDDPSSRRMTYLFRFYDLDAAAYGSLCTAKRADPGREFIDIVLDYCMQRAGKPRWAEKTPGNIRHYHLIRSQWPGARLVHVTREYKDCFASWKARRGDDLDTFLAAAQTAYADIAPLLGRRTESYMEIDHDALVTDPEGAMRRVTEFAGLPWDPACARLDLEATRREREKVIEVVGRDSHTNVSLSKPIFTDAIGQWRELLTAAEARRIETELAPYYARLGQGWAA
jgi:hypothetical protein